MGGAYDTREIALNAGGPLGGGNWTLGASDSQRRRSRARQRLRLAARLGQLRHRARRRRPRCSSPGAIPRSEREGFPDDSGGYEFADIRDTENRDADEAVFGAGVTHARRQRHVRADAGLLRSRRPHRFARRRAGHPRSVRRAAQRGRHRASTRYSATLTGTQKFSDLLSLAYGVDWLREEGTSDGTLDFGGGFVLPTSFELTRTSWAPFAEVRLDIGLRPVAAGRRARRQARRRRLGHQPARARGVRIRRQRVHAGRRLGQGLQTTEPVRARTSAGRQSGSRAGARRVATSSSCRRNCSTARRAGARPGSTANSATPSTSIRVRRPCW